MTVLHLNPEVKPFGLSPVTWSWVTTIIRLICNRVHIHTWPQPAYVGGLIMQDMLTENVL